MENAGKQFSLDFARIRSLHLSSSVYLSLKTEDETER